MTLLLTDSQRIAHLPEYLSVLVFCLAQHRVVASTSPFCGLASTSHPMLTVVHWPLFRSLGMGHMLNTSTRYLQSRGSIDREAATPKAQMGRHVDGTFARPLFFPLTLTLSAGPSGSLEIRHMDHCQTLARSYSREVCPSTALNHTADSHTLAEAGSLQSPSHNLSAFGFSIIYPPSPAPLPFSLPSEYSQ